MYDYVRSNTDKKVVLSGLPYLPVVPFCSDIEERTIFSVCRLDPIKRVETLIDVAPRVNGKIILWLYTMDFLRNYSKTIEVVAKEQTNIECLVTGFPFKEKSIFEALSRVNSYYSSTVWGSGTGVEYAALEAMNNLCVPVIRSNMKSDYEREGYRGFFWEYHEDLIRAIECSFIDRSMLYDNLEILTENCNNFKNMFVEISEYWRR
jgi:glycosyltransferase involved in cell wall biosynthesis